MSTQSSPAAFLLASVALLGFGLTTGLGANWTSMVASGLGPALNDALSGFETWVSLSLAGAVLLICAWKVAGLRVSQAGSERRTNDCLIPGVVA